MGFEQGLTLGAKRPPIEPPSVAGPESVELLIPLGENDAKPEISIVVPALNEQITIGEFVDWCKEGLERAGVTGEIIIVDSSSDLTAKIALDRGARVLRTPKRGLGRAYIDAIPHVRGEFVVMGDCDLTYDFRELLPFVAMHRKGYDFVMGSRFNGVIESGAMPKLHRYFGSPLTTWAFNTVHNKRYSDINCGMRGISLALLKKLALTSQGWEYASEMIVKAEALGAKSVEVPIKFYRDREGRESHLKRSGWTVPWAAGWDNLRVIVTLGARRILVPVSAALILLGCALMGLLSVGPVTVLPGMTWTLHALYFGVTAFTCGFALLHLSFLSAVINDRLAGAPARWVRRFPYTRSVGLGVALIVSGVIPVLLLFARWFENRMTLGHADVAISHLSTVGLGLIIAGTLHISFTLLLHSLTDRLHYS